MLINELIEIKCAAITDVPLILSFIKELAAYEKLSHIVVTTEENLKEALFGERKYAEVIIAYLNDQPVGFALFFHNFSTFSGRPGIYLEDLYVKPGMRGKGIGQKLLSYLAQIAKERQCARMEWLVLNWNQSAIGFYEKLGAEALDSWVAYRITGEAITLLANKTKSN